MERNNFVRRMFVSFMVFGSVPGLMWSCQDSSAIAPRSAPAIIAVPPAPHHHQPTAVTPPSADHDKLQKKLNDLSDSIDELRGDVKAHRKDLE